ncbi:NAD(P)-dependent oxidoreductase [Acidomonas methanolica]|uniref:NAD(P)-dependent oxidoreductase n=1 Tax=Acidomonas methanolica TaxID=437 RepID=UPI00211A9BC9|nr:NAD(P)-dependent oxidoreductase [Acidomonas methanolica]MCQ9156656.1 glyoxylate reductase (NADP(+)) [Acidomonas methanolica]
MLIRLRPLVLVNQSGLPLDDILERHGDQVRIVDGRRDAAQPWDVGEADILVTGPSAEWKSAPPSAPGGWRPGDRGNTPGWVHIVSAGVDGFPSWLLNGRAVTCGRGNAAVPIAEFVLGAILLHEKRLDRLRISNGAEWRDQSDRAKRLAPLGTLENKSLGIAGYGAIGRAVAARARGFGLRVLSWRRSVWEAEDRRLVEPVDTLEELVSRADHLLLALPLTENTAQCVNERLLAFAKPGLHLINVARGGLVDEEALLGALDDGRVAAATLDVAAAEPPPDGHRFYTHPRIHLTPHVSWSGPRVAAASTRHIAENLERFLAGRDMLDVVDPVRGY